MQKNALILGQIRFQSLAHRIRQCGISVFPHPECDLRHAYMDACSTCRNFRSGNAYVGTCVEEHIKGRIVQIAGLHDTFTCTNALDAGINRFRSLIGQLPGPVCQSSCGSGHATIKHQRDKQIAFARRAGI